MTEGLRFAGGRNIAMKVPPHLYDATVNFYRNIVGLEPIASQAPAVGFVFGKNQLWIDRVPGLSQAELWLELVTNDVAGASKHLEAAGVVRCDEIEPLPQGLNAFWISAPASIIHLVCDDEGSW